ncbi:hypothetical protein LTR37_003840 [Vermiconidia calcicola]|uniref:Uncharacterized protein n=1 Tax=Vermiconidia calcicola TaxID=1690605 RepID=A0ACC3NRS2_9PEZI|nr:hypothetical protein LTR37_003840 [Vermiconidia calcicola]
MALDGTASAVQRAKDEPANSENQNQDSVVGFTNANNSIDVETLLKEVHSSDPYIGHCMKKSMPN